MNLTSPRIAVVCASGIGDALIYLVLSYNIAQAGYQIDTFSTSICELKNWFPKQNIFPFPESHSLIDTFSCYDWVISADHSLVSEIQGIGKKFTLLKENHFDKRKNLTENLLDFCKNHLEISNPILTNGITPPIHAKFQAHSKRVILHPESTEPKRTWISERFLQLGDKLQEMGFKPAICVGPHERDKWKVLLQDSSFDFPSHSSLNDLASYIYESYALIGNNSGLGHLASCLGLPTISLFARMSYANLWRPGFGKNHVVTPLPFLLGANLKNKYWQKALFPFQVIKAFKKL